MTSLFIRYLIFIIILFSFLGCGPEKSNSAPTEKQTAVKELDTTKFNSGLSIGENLPAIDVTFLTGPDMGKTKCPMCSYGSGQGVFLFWNSKDKENMWALLKKFDAQIEKQGLKKLRVFAVYTNPMKENIMQMQEKLFDRASMEGITNSAIAFVPPSTPAEEVTAYRLNGDASIINTIFIYKQRTVIGKFVNYRGSDISPLLELLKDR